MTVRALIPTDMIEVRRLAGKHFPHLEVPDFMNGFYCAYAITDNDNNIIIAGGLQPTAEIIQITNKDMGEFKIGRALIDAQKAALYVGNKFELSELVAFTPNSDTYARHLIKHGFYPRNSALAIKVPYGKK